MASALIPPHVAAVRDLVDVVFDGVARHCGLAEFGFVDGEEIHGAAFAETHLTQAQHARGLRHAFDQEHARHHRITGKMPGKLRFVDGDVLDADAVLLAADIDDAIDHEKRVAMR